jgi:cytochrome c
VRKFIPLIAGISLLTAAVAGEMATPDEAKALSEKAQAAVNDMGKDKAFAAFVDPAGGYQEKDLYVFCLDTEGVALFHAKKPELAGKNLMDFNKYGDYLFRDMVNIAKGPGEGWVDYKWPYPGSEEIKEKTSYIMKNNEGFFCGVGAYK